MRLRRGRLAAKPQSFLLGFLACFFSSFVDLFFSAKSEAAVD
jgi:hypothetical protein